jgi:predicted phosphodiesterase
LGEEKKERKKLSVVVLSDTHGDLKQLKRVAELSGDIFIHAGDFTYYGRDKDFQYFFNYLDKLNFRHKIVISGNHEIALDNGCISPQRRVQYLDKYPCSVPSPLNSSAEIN